MILCDDDGADSDVEIHVQISPSKPIETQPKAEATLDFTLKPTKKTKPNFVEKHVFDAINSAFEEGKAVLIQGEFSSRWDLLINFFADEDSFCLNASSFESPEDTELLTMQLRAKLFGTSLKNKISTVVIEDFELMPEAIIKLLTTEKKFCSKVICATHDSFPVLRKFYKQSNFWLLRMFTTGKTPKKIGLFAFGNMNDKFDSSYIFASEVLHGRHRQNACLTSDVYAQDLICTNYPLFCRNMLDVDAFASMLSDYDLTKKVEIDLLSKFCSATLSCQPRKQNLMQPHRQNAYESCTAKLIKKLKVDPLMASSELFLIQQKASCDLSFREELAEMGFSYDDFNRQVKLAR